MRVLFRTSLAVALLALGACGQKGPLNLPPPAAAGAASAPAR
ncbi:MAG TPA: lipoprotein [Rubrivivax sp.]|nr:lipoprotein [Rubrivivax sp.]